jgi:DNA-binding winged helix-turn-helix (wHTH) protein
LQSESYQFGPFRFDAEKHLWRDREFVSIGTKSGQVLLHLIQNAGQIVKKQQLIDLAWGEGANTEEGALTYEINQIRKALGDDYKNPTYIRTVWGDGYIFIAPVTKRSNQERVETLKIPTAIAQSSEPLTTLASDAPSLERVADPNPTAESFGAWLSALVKAKKLPRAFYTEESLLKVGQCTVIRTAIDPRGYEDIVMTQEPQTRELKLGIEIADRSEWETELKKLDEARVSGTSAQVTQFLPELTDDPKARMRYRLVRYAEARAFHEILQNNVGLSRRYRESILQVLSDRGTDVPNILATAVVAIIGADAKKPELVLANRMGRVGSYHGSSWAVSIGEQFMPVTGTRRGRVVERDGTILRSAERGLREEILSERYSGNLGISIHAFILEDYIDNFFFLAIADLRPLTFNQLTQLWRESLDSNEHNAIAALPLTEDVLLECIQEDGLPEGCWSRIIKADSLAVQPGISITPNMHRWQPNSHIRLAGCLWYLKDQLTNKAGSDQSSSPP